MMENTNFIVKIDEIIVQVQETISFITQNYQIQARDKIFSVLQKLDYVRGQFIKESNDEFTKKIEQTMIKVQEAITLVTRNLQIPARDKLLGIIQKLNTIKVGIVKNENN